METAVALLVTQLMVAAVLALLLLREGRQRKQAVAKLRKRLEALPAKDELSRLLTVEASERIVTNHNKMAADMTELKKQLLHLQRSAGALGIKKLMQYDVASKENVE